MGCVRIEGQIWVHALSELLTNFSPSVQDLKHKKANEFNIVRYTYIMYIQDLTQKKKLYFQTVRYMYTPVLE